MEIASTRPLAGTLVVSLDQAVAAPLTSRRLADAGARVIKLERPEGDFARDYDDRVLGQCSYFVWLNRGKESVVADLGNAEDRRLFDALLAKADIFLQNLKPGALAKLGYPIAQLRQLYPKLICCSISGYGEEGPYRDRKAYDLLIQAECGLASITGGPEAPARVGISLVDICTGLHAYEAVLEALIARATTGRGADVRVSMFDTMMELMAVPLLHAKYATAPPRLGMTHPTLAPYGVFDTADGIPILIAIQNDREWSRLCSRVIDRPEAAKDARFANSIQRTSNRAATDGLVAAYCASQPFALLARQLEGAEIAFARVNDLASVLNHPHLREIAVSSPAGPVRLPAPPARITGDRLTSDRPPREAPASQALPRLGEHSAAVRREFLSS
jgi:itaconate CoA-transferase